MREGELSMKITMDDIFKNGGAISDFKKDYSERPSQTEGAKIIEQGLSERANVLLEGETGFGKSYAYIFPILNDIAESGFKKKAVIATSGISLQEQLYTKDLPFAIDVMKSLYPNWPGDFTFTLLKGRQNFICNKKVAELGLYTTNRSMIDGSYKDICDFVNETKTGDMSELSFIPRQDILNNIACTQKGECVGKDCEFSEECHYNKHKLRLNSSEVIITNYHMLYSDMNTGGKILPAYDILVFDEAHEAAGIFRDFDASRLTINNAIMLRNKASEVNNTKKDQPPIVDQDMFQGIIKDFEIAFNDIENKFQNLNSANLISSADELPKSFMDLNEGLDRVDSEISRAYDKQNSIFESVKCAFEEEDKEYREQSKIVKLLDSMSEMCSEMIYIINNLKAILEDNNNVVWVEKVNDIVAICQKRVEVGNALNESFFGREGLTSIFTSATISVGGSFEYIKEQLGLNIGTKKTLEFIGASPFNLTEQQLWYLPQNAMDGNKFGFDNTIAPNMRDIIEAVGGGALCLFTSVRNMRNAQIELNKYLGNKYTIYTQGDMPRTKLIEAFKDNRDSILLGTKSFFTGVDVPGEALRAVIIDKFPFPQPTDPVQQKLKDRANSFYRYSIPEMIISLKQAIGRGVRGVDDKCVISILDGRMSTAKYKSKINNSFNYKKTGTRNIEDLKKFRPADVVDFISVDYSTDYDPDEIPF